MTQAIGNNYHNSHILEMAKEKLLLEEFLVKQSNLNERDSYGRNILYWAIKNRSQHNIKLLLKYNVDLMVENDLHALFHTISSNDADTFILLLNSNMTNINMRNKESQTLLMKAIEVESIEMVRHLINHGADLFSVDDNGNSPIDYAKKCKNINVFELVHYRILFEKIQTKKSA